MKTIKTIKYKISYRIVENGKQYAGVIFTPKDLNEYLDELRKKYPDASVTYTELLDTIEEEEVEDDELSSDTIILCTKNMSFALTDGSSGVHVEYINWEW